MVFFGVSKECATTLSFIFYYFWFKILNLEQLLEKLDCWFILRQEKFDLNSKSKNMVCKRVNSEKT